MRDVRVKESGQIPGATWTEMILIPMHPDLIEKMRVIYSQLKEIVCERIISREELEAAIEEIDGRGSVVGYRVCYRLEADQTIRFLPQSEYRVQGKIKLYDGTVKKSYMVYCITADTDEYADNTEEEEKDGGI